jgi:hypothetical protein
VLAFSESYFTQDSFAAFSDVVMFAEQLTTNLSSPPAIADNLSITDKFEVDPGVRDAVLFLDVVAGVPAFFNETSFGDVRCDGVSFHSSFRSDSGFLAGNRYRR